MVHRQRKTTSTHQPKTQRAEILHELKQNLHGCKQAAENLFKHLTVGLKKQGFTPSKTDSCLFLRRDCILAVYVDDSLIFAKNDNMTQKLIQELSKTYLLQDEGDVSAFLRVQIRKDKV
jgi:hypothetical protein